MDTNDLLRFALHVIGRFAIPPPQLREIVDTGPKRVKAFNLCDGSRNQKEIADESGIDHGNLSRVIARWREHGAIFVLGSGKSATYLHIYPLAPEKANRAKNTQGGRKAKGKRRRKTAKK